MLKKSTFSLVDLAGSEKWNVTQGLGLAPVSLANSNLGASQSSLQGIGAPSGAGGPGGLMHLQVQAQADLQKEMLNINASLHVLGNCVAALIEPNRKHIPFRDSVLTRLLQVMISLLYSYPSYRPLTSPLLSTPYLATHIYPLPCKSYFSLSSPLTLFLLSTTCLALLSRGHTVALLLLLLLLFLLLLLLLLLQDSLRGNGRTILIATVHEDAQVPLLPLLALTLTYT